jgi:hypothetical protein
MPYPVRFQRPPLSEKGELEPSFLGEGVTLVTEGVTGAKEENKPTPPLSSLRSTVAVRSQPVDR